jgi:Flp pilus assembly protein TadG
VSIPATETQGRGRLRARPRRPRRRSERAVTLVEFALVAPVLLLLLLGLLVLGIAITNQVQLSNAVRDGARAAALCGGAGTNSVLSNQATTTTTTLPNGWPCSTANLERFVNTSLSLIPDAAPHIGVIVGGSDTPGDLSTCQPGTSVQITATFQQSLYLPLIGYLLGDAGNPGVRTLSAQAQATCEQ